MVMGAYHGIKNPGTQSGPPGNSDTGGTLANTGGGSPWTSVRGQDGNQDTGRHTNTGNDSTGVEWGEARYETIPRNPPGAER